MYNLEIPRRILVLGANSFAGSTFINHISHYDFKVVGTSRSPKSTLNNLVLKDAIKSGKYIFHKIDINLNLGELIKIIQDFKPSYIIDFAGQGMVAESWAHPTQWYKTNILAKIDIFEYLKDKVWLKKYIRISTPEVYGSKQELVLESSGFNPSTPYAISHAAIDMNMRIYFERYSFPAVIGRFSNFYGPGQQLFRIVPRTIISALNHEKLPLHGKGESERSFLYSQDFSTAIESLIDSGRPGQIYNFSNSEVVSIRKLISIICKKIEIDFDDLVSEIADRPSKDQKYLMNSEKSEKELGWKSKFDLETGLDSTINWYIDNVENLRGLPVEYVYKP
jgi:dTDP-glucose 4,6-dehydratase